MSDEVVSIQKTWLMSCAHQLEDHDGQCAHLHGHNYNVTLRLEGIRLTTLSEDGMIMDYAYLGGIVKPLIEAMDHAFLYSPIQTEWVIANMTQIRKAYALGMRTTAENLAIHIWRKIRPAFDGMYGNVTFLEVSVSETPKTIATYGAFI
jgi:6-pyruvoyltetrahydropterin/6-carboxytetrahydropterin synthase